MQCMIQHGASQMALPGQMDHVGQQDVGYFRRSEAAAAVDLPATAQQDRDQQAAGCRVRAVCQARHSAASVCHAAHHARF